MLWIRSNMVFFGTQGQVTPKWIVWSGRNLNLSEILWLSWLSASLKMIRSKVKVLSTGQHFLHCKSMGKFFITQGRIIPWSTVHSGPKSKSAEILWLSSLPASLDEDLIIWSCYPLDNIFPIISLWLPWKPEFWPNLPQNHMLPFPHPSDATYKVWSKLANWSQRYWSVDND